MKWIDFEEWKAEKWFQLGESSGIVKCIGSDGKIKYFTKEEYEDIVVKQGQEFIMYGRQDS